MILLDTNVVSETFKPAPEPLVIEWLIRHDAEIALPSVTLAELAYGIEKIRPDQRALRLERGLAAWYKRFRDRIYAFTEAEAMAYGEIMGEAERRGRPMSLPDGMIAATARRLDATLATRNITDFQDCGIDLINPWSASGVHDR